MSLIVRVNGHCLSLSTSIYQGGAAANLLKKISYRMRWAKYAQLTVQRWSLPLLANARQKSSSIQYNIPMRANSSGRQK